MGKRLNVRQLSQKEYVDVPGLSDEMRDAIGDIEDTFTMIIYGGSGNGKTNFTIKLLKELKVLGSALYISYEEAHGKTVKKLVLRHNLVEELPNLTFSDGESFEDLMALLGKKKSYKIVVIDTWQYTGFTYAQYKQLKEAFVFGKTAGKRKILIIISHIKGKEPDGTSAIQVKRDCNIKIYVEKFVADIVSRFDSKKNYLIHEEGAVAYWGNQLEAKLNKQPVNMKAIKANAKKKKAAKPKKEEKPAEPVTHMQVAEPAEKPVFKQTLEQIEKAS